MSGWGGGGPGPDQMADVVNSILAAGPYAKTSDVDTAAAAQVNAVAPGIVAPLTAPFFRFSVAPGLIALNSVLVGILVDRPGTLQTLKIVATGLTSGSMSVTLKKNGAVVKTAVVSTTLNAVDLSTPSVPIVADDKLTLEVSTFTLVIGLGTVYGHIKTVAA